MKSRFSASMTPSILAAAGILSTCTVVADACEPSLPTTAAAMLASAYPNHRTLQLEDLNADDQGIWQGSHGDACPGVVRGFFVGKEEVFAVLLVPKSAIGGDVKAVLVDPAVGGRASPGQIFAEQRAENLPAIRRGEPGIYREVDKNVKVRIENDTVLIDHLKGWVTAIAVVNGRVRTLTIAD